MDALKQPIKQVVNPSQTTNDKQQAIMEKQRNKDEQTETQELANGEQRVKDPVTGEHMVSRLYLAASIHTYLLSCEKYRRLRMLRNNRKRSRKGQTYLNYPFHHLVRTNQFRLSKVTYKTTDTDF